MNKASGGDGIPVELFQILKDDAVKVLPSICQQMWKAQQWPQDWKRSVFFPIPKKGNVRECSNYCTIALISPRDGGAWWAAIYGVVQSRTRLKQRSAAAAHASKVILKILQARLQQYVNHQIPDVQDAFRKGRGTRDQIANFHWILEEKLWPT